MKKLTLNRETLCLLKAHDALHVRGGMLPVYGKCDYTRDAGDVERCVEKSLGHCTSKFTCPSTDVC